jgi:hypothetical protein
MARLGSFKSGVNSVINSDISAVQSRAKPLASPLVWMPIWICMENNFVRLNTKEEIELACKLACIHHNGYLGGTEEKPPYCPEDDWQYISEREVCRAGLRCYASDSDNDDC